MTKAFNNRRKKELLNFCNTNNININDLKILHNALTHTSYANEYKNEQIEHNERLEFLGDAVLDLVISDYLYCQFPNLPEGELTKIRAQVVCEPTIAKMAEKIKLGNYLLLGKGEASTGGRERISILADTFEAVVGAIYLNSGFSFATKFILHQLHSVLGVITRGEYIKEDYKTLLQEYIQRQNGIKILYNILREFGPDHDKSFEVVVLINNIQFGSGIGKSKKEAEQNAANKALKSLNIIH